MAAKVDTPAEPLHAQSISSNSTKVSKFGAKSGFVIPKNKLSGSLVPVIRAGGKVDTNNILKEEGNKQPQRKTKWGIDMTKDDSVRKGLILAYQTRLEQITEQLKTGVLEPGSNQNSKSPTQSSPHAQPGSLLTEMNGELMDQLEHEKREVIGEILRLNPSYKAPFDYKPLLKEAKVPIPVKLYPEYNFLGLLLGSESNTQKRLEEETGVKIRVYGTNSDTKEKCEITQSDVNEKHITYEEVYVLVSADTYDKVDAAVALLELLVTPVSGKPAVSAALTDNTNSLDVGVILDKDKKDHTSGFTTMTMGPVVPPVATSSQTGPFQYQPYPVPWYTVSSAGAPPQPLSGFSPSPLSNNPMRLPPSPVNRPNMPPFLGVHSPRNPSGVISGTQSTPQVMQQHVNQPIPLQKDAISIQKPPPPYPVMPLQPLSNTPPFPASQLMPAGGALPTTRPGLPQSLPSPMTPLGSHSNRLTTPSLPPGNSSRPGVPVSVPPQLGPNMIQMTTQNPHPSIPQNSAVTLTSQENMPPQGRSSSGLFSAPSVLPSHSSIARPTGSPIVQSMTSSVPTAVQPPNFVPAPAPRPFAISVPSSASNPGLVSVSTSVSVQVPLSTQSASLPTTSLASIPRVSTQISTPTILNSPARPPPAMPGSLPGSAPAISLTSSTSIPPMSMPKPPRPPGDFTFQPARSPVAVSLTSPRPNILSAAQATPQIQATSCQAPFAQGSSPIPTRLPPGPSFRPTLQNPGMPLRTVGPPRHQAVNPVDRSHSPILPSSSVVSHSSNLVNLRSPPGLPHFPNSQHAASMASLNHSGAPSFAPPSFAPPTQALNLQGLTPGRPPTLMPLQKPLAPADQARGFLVPNQHLGKPGSGPIGNQIYDPFLPTSIRPIPPPKINEQTKTVKSENDAEYEDLMASVGVR